LAASFFTHDGTALDTRELNPAPAFHAKLTQRLVKVKTRARADEIKEIEPKAILLRIAADYERVGRKKLGTLVGQKT
jgi:hypothetical protein